MSENVTVAGTVIPEAPKTSLIGIAGQKQNGKNTICNIIFHNFPSQVIIHSFAEPIREITKIFGFTLEDMTVKKEDVHPFWGISWRRFAQLVGTEMFRKVFRKDVWIKMMEMKINKDTSNFKFILIDDVRFPNEVIMIKKLGGTVIRVIRPSMQTAQSKWAIIRWIKSFFLHASEKPLPSELIDHEIINDGTEEELKDKVLKLLDGIDFNKTVRDVMAKVKQEEEKKYI